MPGLRYTQYTVCAEYLRRISENVISHARWPLKMAAADLEGFAHSAAAQLETAQEIRRISVSEFAIALLICNVNC